MLVCLDVRLPVFVQGYGRKPEKQIKPVSVKFDLESKLGVWGLLRAELEIGNFGKFWEIGNWKLEILAPLEIINPSWKCVWQPPAPPEVQLHRGKMARGKSPGGRDSYFHT